MRVEQDQRVRDYLRDIAESSERCARHIGDMGYAQFAGDERTLDAVCKCVEAVGTAAKNLLELSPEIETCHPELQLRRAYSTRIRLAHGYREIDPEILWATGTKSLPALAAAARKVLTGSCPLDGLWTSGP
jgi:uncharacterized protein with HEPN domain